MEPEIEARTHRRWKWIVTTIHNGAFTVTILSLSLILLMGFQSWELHDSNRHVDQEAQARRRETAIITQQSGTIKELTDRVVADEKFFGLIRQLVLLGNSQSPEAQAQRQAILDQLRQQEVEAQRGTAPASATTTSPSPPGTSMPSSPPTTQPERSPPTSTTTTSTTTTTVPVQIPVPHPPIPCITVPILNRCVQ